MNDIPEEAEPVVNEQPDEILTADIAPVTEERTNGQSIAKYYPQRRESAFNIEFDGIITAEGVLEMMPDGYGFLH